MADGAPPIKFKALMRPGTFAKGIWTPAAWKNVLVDPNNTKEARTYQVRSAVVFLSAALEIPKTDVIAAHPVVGGEGAQASVVDLFASADFIATVISW